MSCVKHSDKFNEDYFMRGQELGISGYTSYSWMPDLTIPMVRTISEHLGIDQNDSILDFGCARGYVVRAFRELGYDAYGVDVSKWAIEHADEIAKPHVLQSPWPLGESDWIIAKDVLEHVPELEETVANLMRRARKGVFAVVPLADVDNQFYVVREYEKDITHIHRFTLGSWAKFFTEPGWSVTLSYRVPGVKDNYAQFSKGNGFITCRRQSDS